MALLSEELLTFWQFTEKKLKQLDLCGNPPSSATTIPDSQPLHYNYSICAKTFFNGAQLGKGSKNILQVDIENIGPKDGRSSRKIKKRVS